MSNSRLRQAFRRLRPAFGALVGFSAASHLVGLAGPIFSLQVFDRVLNGRSLATLGLLLAITVFLLALQALLEGIRSRVLVRIGTQFDDEMAAPVFRQLLSAGVVAPRNQAHANAIRDLDQIRDNLAGPSAIAFLDAPFIPIYLFACFLFHPLFGLLVLVSGVILAALAWLNEAKTRNLLRNAQEEALASNEMALAYHRQAEVISAMGMLPAMALHYRRRRDAVLGWQGGASDRSGAIAAQSRLVRALLPVLATALGAWLVLGGAITPGVLVAAAMIAARALMPIDMLVTSWRGLQGARLSWERLEALEAIVPSKEVGTRLPRPRGHIEVSRLVVAPPGTFRPGVRNVSFSLRSGQVLGVIGPSGSGKTTLVKALVGAIAPLGGEIRVDGALVQQYDPDVLGAALGYLPQDSQLFAGTIAQNIARFEDAPDVQAILSAARRARVHDLVTTLPQGYDTVIGDGGQGLSGGQRQRVALARALYGDPAILILDEPNAALDGDGENALLAAVAELKAAGTTIVIVTHKLPILALADVVLMLDAGEQRVIGPRAKVFEAISQGRMGHMPPGVGDEPAEAPPEVRIGASQADLPAEKV